MASPSSLLPEENLSCSTCLGVFTGPVNLPCGHNFCGACVATRWDGDVQSRCPACAERSPAGRESRDDALTPEAAQRVGDAAVGPGEVFCHVCTGPKRKALKSCLECATSFCGAHLEPHHRAPGLRRHKLIRPEHDLEDRVCERHGRPLELFCKTDRTCVCELCTESDHRDHAVAPLEEEYGARKAELGETASELEGMILERRRRIEEIKLLVELGRENADREEASGAWFFTALKLSVDRYRAEHRERIREERESAEKRAEGLVGELEREIEKLADRSSELKRLSLAEDHLHLLRSFQSLNAPPPTRDWTTFELSRPSYAGTLRRALALLEEALKTKLLEAELRILQQHEVDLTLDPDTANPYLTLSEDGKQVYDGDVRKKVPDNPERFSKGACVFTKQSFSRGRFYFEVGVQGKSCWTLGVVRESINRKGDVILKPEYGCWTIWLRNGNEYQALSSPFVPLSLRAKPQKVGVFVDYDEGLVSFYDAESRVHIHSFTGCAFEEPLYPFLSPSLNDGGKNSAPLIISPALKSCLECATSFCGAHLEPHHRAPGLRRHKLIRPKHDLEDRVCERHGGPLELFCKTDRTCVCELCTESDHRDHAVAPLEEEYGARKAELGETASELEGMILERRRRIEEIKLSVELGRENADREEASGAWFFTALKLSVDRYRAEHRERIREERESAEKRAEGLVGELEREIEKLADRSSELKRLSLAEDHLHLLRSFQSLNAPPPTRDWTTFELSRPSYAGTLRRALALLEEALKTKLLEAELRILQQHEVDLTLDPDTANPYLTLSEDGKQVYDGDVRKKVPDNPERFSKGACVFTKQSFSRGRFYFEVGVRGKSCWTLGVVRESINRKGDVILKPEYGCWTIWLRNGNEYQALSSPFVPLSLRAKPQKVGVFVDYDEGLVSFYDAESRVHIHSFTGCAFEEPLYPFLSPSLNDGGKNSAPLIISPVSQTH